MKVYDAANLRNLALIGHGHAGKTSLVSAMLYTAGASPRTLSTSVRARVR